VTRRPAASRLPAEEFAAIRSVWFAPESGYFGRFDHPGRGGSAAAPQRLQPGDRLTRGYRAVTAGAAGMTPG
jgi:hypothetical protein